MARITRSRIADVEKKLPRPREPMQIIETVVSPNPNFGGPPIVEGVIERVSIADRAMIVEYWPDLIPESELPEFPDLAAWRRARARGSC